MNTELAIYNPSAPLVKASGLSNLPVEIYARIGNAFPDPGLSDDARITKAMAICAQCEGYVMTAKDPSALTRCCMESWMEVLQAIASVDLPMVRSLGYAALVPFKGVLTLMLQYQGLSELIMRSGAVASLQAHLVYKQDEFDVILGSNPDVIHKPDYSRPRLIVDMTHAYCIAFHKSGPIQPEVMTRKELEVVKKAGNPNSPAWKYYPEEMYRKAPTRRIAKRLKKQVGGVPQTALAHALTIEDSQYDHSRLDRYAELRQEHRTEQEVEARDAANSPLEMDDRPERPEGWIEARQESTKSFWAMLKDIRENETDLTNKEWLDQVMFDMNQAGEITTTANLNLLMDFIAVFDAVVNLKQFTLDTGERIPA